MFKDITGCLLMSWLMVISCYASQSESSMPHRQLIETSLEQGGIDFGSLEHQRIGNKVRLYWDPLTPPPSGKLTLPNGLQLSYGEIIMYAGDFFGNTSKVISSCSPDQQEECFYSQFSTLGLTADDPNHPCSDPFLLTTAYGSHFAKIQEKLDMAQQKGQDEWDFFKEYSSDNTKTLNRISCGGSFVSALIPFGSYLKLASVNMDHFVPDSLTAYKAGHNAALKSAINAHKYLQKNQNEKAREALHLAYAQNAFANHYLTDSMSSGHMRTPRRAVHNTIALPDILNLVIANFMHDEDSRYGLNVVNSRGIAWRAFGDHYLKHPDAQPHYEMILKITQMSVDAVYTAFLTGQIPDEFEELAWLPDYSNIDSLNNHAPLFKWEDGHVLKRVKNHDPYDYHWTKYWSGLLMLLDFQIHGKSGSDSHNERISG
ncbi:phospholipase [Legionella spiritensis]|uniref:phospholipase n=1 Tax=Legionella spiritensis TaxID=452 RepID=UPI000F6D940F|nr:phospholipase [Legionella spiritensis]VEG90035.1 phospholipase C [Legionella spiritensis]